jgi:carbamoylphosphate synthase large subunit
LRITGPFNVKYLAKLNEVKVIECNLRASRSFPFVSKVTGNNFVIEAMRRMLGVTRAVENHSIDLDYVAVKAPMFSFSRLVGADPMLGVEMAAQARSAASAALSTTTISLALQRAADILFLVIGQQNRGNLIKHLQVRLRRTHGLHV